MADLEPLQTENLSEKFSWEKPERKDQAGSLVIFGGSSFKLKEVDSLFKAAKKYGVGVVSALVPESLAKVFKRDDPYLIPIALDSYFGLTDVGFKALQEESLLADGLILADIGNNSSTILKLARLASSSLKPVVLTDSTLSLILSHPNEILQNKLAVLVISFQNLQKLIKASNIELGEALTSQVGINKKIDTISKLSSSVQAKVVLIDEGRIISVDQDYYINLELESSTLELTAHLAAWDIWSPTTPFLERLFISNQKS